MTVLKILLGLCGLGVVVFVHELGHFLAARLVGIDVEAFSIGWGKAVWKKKIGTVEYRLGPFPLGGYCKMRGENEFQEAYDNWGKKIPAEKGSFFGTHPLKRIVVSLGGPLFNLIFAVLVLSAIWGAGFEANTLDNRIVLVSDVNPGERYPADEGGLTTGDKIVEINSKAIGNYRDLQEAVATNPEKTLEVQVERDGQLVSLILRPLLDKSDGIGKIGVYPWTDPVVSSVQPESPAAIAGLQNGDRLLSANGREIPYHAALFGVLQERPQVLSLEFDRGGRIMNADLILTYDNEGNAEPGIAWETIRYQSPRLSLPAALAKGSAETAKTMGVSLKSLGLLFRGIDLTQAVSGPVRITYMAGDIAAEGFGQSIGAGISSMANFLALISIVLCVMNLLPLPVLDGGQALLFLFEALRGRPLHPKAVYAFQAVGWALVLGLMIFAVFADILFLARR